MKITPHHKGHVAVARIKRHTHLPVAVGFGVKTPEQAASDLQGKVEAFMRRRGYLKT